MIDSPFKGMVIELPPEQYDRAMAAISRASAAIGALREKLIGEGNCMNVKNAEINKGVLRMSAFGADVINSRRISPEARQQATVKLLKAKEKIRTHYCKCGSFIPESADGLCAKCRKPLTEEYKAKLNSPAEIGLAASLHTQGYEPHFQAIECEAVIGTRCKLCAGACYYIGLKKGSSYKAISRCVKCGNEIEI
jgi:hypothetical protein